MRRGWPGGLVQLFDGLYILYALCHWFLDEITVIPLLSEGNYSSTSVTEKVKRSIVHKHRYLTAYFRTTSLKVGSRDRDLENKVSQKLILCRRTYAKCMHLAKIIHILAKYIFKMHCFFHYRPTGR